MAKVLTKDIAKALAEKKGLSYEEAEGYVNSFFSLVDDSLIPEKIVKIKGFGTFKLIEVRDRESVDVNTGERMVIDGHSKISFTPDSTFKDLVNKPFSQFETVVMNDSAEIEKDFAALEQQKPEEQEPVSSFVDTPVQPSLSDIPAQSSSADVTRQSPSVDVPVVASSENVSLQSEDAEDEKVEENVERSDDERVEEAAKQENENLSAAESSSVADDDVHIDTSFSEDEIDLPTVHVGVVQENDTPSLIVSDEEPDSEKPQDDVDLNASSDEANDGGETIASDDSDTEEESPAKKRPYIRVVVYSMIAVVLMVVIFSLGYYLGDRSSKVTVPKDMVYQTKQHVQNKVAQTKPTPVAPQAEKHDSVIQKQEEDNALKSKEQVAEKEKVKDKDTSPELDNDTKQALSGARKIASTGAYIIVGTEKSIKVKAGQTMKSIARMYLGDGMECYVQLHNGKLEVREGETINIPKLKLKKKAANKKVS